MKPTMLVSGGDTPLGNSIIQKALADGYNVVATAPSMSRGTGDHDPSESGEESESLILVPWGRSSPVSARNVILRALSARDAIDQAIILHNLTNEHRALHELPIIQIQEITDRQLKSHFFLAKEIVAQFMKRKKGVLSLVVDREGTEQLATMDSLVTEGFVSLVNSLMGTYRRDPIVINGFDSRAGDADGYASFILSTLREPDRPGKWFQYGPRGGLLRSAFRSRVKH